MAKKTTPTIPGLDEDSARFLEDLQKETDRGAALVGAAFLDDVLEASLRAFFVDDKKVADQLLGSGDRPVSTFSARTHLAYCLGLLAPKVYADLNQIREIRNWFAHRHHPGSFDDPPVRDWCVALNFWRILPEHVGLTNRSRFVITAAMTAVVLIGNSKRHNHAEVAKETEVIDAPRSDESRTEATAAPGEQVESPRGDQGSGAS
jgi:DNA-binding MltR family transcriptional regulator